MPLSDIHIRNAKPQEKQYKLSDGRGLYLLIHPSGGKRWRYKYRWLGKEKLLALGTYPEVSLKEARESHDVARKQLATGIDPGENRKMLRAANIEKSANISHHPLCLLNNFSLLLWGKLIFDVAANFSPISFGLIKGANYRGHRDSRNWQHRFFFTALLFRQCIQMR